MAVKRHIEIFSAGCALCDRTTQLVEEIACASCRITVVDMKDPTVAARARALGVRSVPAVAVDGALAACCAGGGPNVDALRAAGIGRAPGAGS
jgi:glutaredoxin 3